MNQKLQFGVVGCGKIGKRHLELIIKSGHLLSVCDNDKKVLREITNAYQVKGYESLYDMLSTGTKPDLLAICTPNYLHAQQSIYCLNHNAHVICEKPMALNKVDCQDMIDAARINDKFLFIVKQNRFNPTIKLLKKLIDQGKLGKIYSIQINCFWNRDDAYYKNSWHGSKKFDGGTLFTQFSHFIDLAYWIFGDIKDVSGKNRNYLHKDSIEFEDAGVAWLEFDNGILATLNYTINAYRKNMEGSITVFGQNGTIKIGGQYLNKLEHFEVENMECPIIEEGCLPNDYGNYQGSMSSHHLFYDYMLKTIYGEQPMDKSTNEAMKTVEIIEKIYENSSTY